ncbi:MAG: Crp/Fnr family transcriptional regulator [Pseudomonadota bacterium]|nr:Crp/Fnr family transcriptional regulator [Pseudomonadota bacterium]
MLSPATIAWQDKAHTLPPGATLMRRDTRLTHVLHIDEGRVALGLADGQRMAHPMGLLEGPCWLNVSCAVLGLSPVVDALAESRVRVRSVPLASFQAEMAALPATARSVLHDVSLAYRHQAELSVSRLGKDAEARCAEWLLRHAEPTADAPGTLAVHLLERKRAVAIQLGIAPETLSRVLRQLRVRQLISGTGRVLHLTDPDGLRVLTGH